MKGTICRKRRRQSLLNVVYFSTWQTAFVRRILQFLSLSLSFHIYFYLFINFSTVPMYFCMFMPLSTIIMQQSTNNWDGQWRIQGWEFIEHENSHTLKKPRSRPRKRPRKKRKNFLFFLIVFFLGRERVFLSEFFFSWTSYFSCFLCFFYKFPAQDIMWAWLGIYKSKKELVEEKRSRSRTKELV